MTDPTHGQHDQGDTLRAAQIAAVRQALLDGEESRVDDLAAELVDAVMALAGPPGPTAAAGPIEPDQVGYLVTGDRCGRCGDINYDEQRVCLTCTFPDDPCSRAYLDGLSAPESGRDRPTHGEGYERGRTGRDGETAGRDEAVCICPQIETTTFADLEAGERTFVRGKPNPNCPACPDATGGDRG